LYEAFLQAAEDERPRCWKSHWEQARTKLQAYLEWKRNHSLDCLSRPTLADGEDPNQFDTQLWSLAMEKACEFRQQQEPQVSLAKGDSTTATSRIDCNQPVRCKGGAYSPVTCRHGQRLIAVWPARLPLSALHDTALQTYTTYMALYLYYVLLAPCAKDTDEQIISDEYYYCAQHNSSPQAGYHFGGLSRGS
jgi:hypothetical protein